MYINSKLRLKTYRLNWMIKFAMSEISLDGGRIEELHSTVNVSPSPVILKQNTKLLVFIFVVRLKYQIRLLFQLFLSHILQYYEGMLQETFTELSVFFFFSGDIPDSTWVNPLLITGGNPAQLRRVLIPSIFLFYCFCNYKPGGRCLAISPSQI